MLNEKLSRVRVNFKIESGRWKKKRRRDFIDRFQSKKR